MRREGDYGIFVKGRPVFAFPSPESVARVMPHISDEVGSDGVVIVKSVGKGA